MQLRLRIDSLAYEGAGIGRAEGKVFFVPFGVPGDELLVEVTREKKNFCEARIVEIISPSEHRREPRCEYFFRCGGCQWQHIEYSEQLRWKGRILGETLKRIGKVDAGEAEIVPSPEEFHYRSRARFQVDNDKWGFFEARSKRIVDIEACPLLLPQLNETYALLKEELLGKFSRGLKSVEVGFSETDGKSVAALSLARSVRYKFDGLIKKIPGLKGLEVRVGTGGGGGRGRMVKSAGDTSISFEAAGVGFKAAPGEFTQINRALNNALIERVVEKAALTGNERIADLFCGVGNLSLPLAGSAKSVIGVERSTNAVESAQENARANRIENAVFKGIGADRWLRTQMGKSLESELLDVVVLDPPRGGDLEVVRALRELMPARVVYVSCSPPTLARDLSALTEAGYHVDSLVMIDLFPQTFHIEAIVCLVPGGGN